MTITDKLASAFAKCIIFALALLVCFMGINIGKAISEWMIHGTWSGELALDKIGRTLMVLFGGYFGWKIFVKKDRFGKRVAEWMKVCFSDDIVKDARERADRFCEEALELCQTMDGFTAERAHTLVDYVFGRPVGQRGQEVGGVRVTLAALCNAVGIDDDEEAERELKRINSPAITKKIREKQQAKRDIHGPLP